MAHRDCCDHLVPLAPILRVRRRAPALRLHAYACSDVCIAGWHALFDPIFDQLNTTASRAPFTDLYDTITGELAISSSFIARPVVGALFAKLLL